MTAPKRCTPAIRAGRLVKAQQFHQAADLLSAAADDSEVVDACVMLSVHTGIAAADVICCAKLGEHHRKRAGRAAAALVRSAETV
jgi:hypothetical protein